MITKTSLLRIGFATAVLSLFAACGALEKEPAQKALATVEQAIGSINKDDVNKYLPGGLDEINGSFAALKGAFEKGEYKAVIEGVPALTSKVTALTDKLAEAKEVAEAKVKELTAKWSSLTGELPATIESISVKLVELGKSKLPKGVTKESVDAAKTGLTSLKDGWNAASTAFSGGKIEEAVAQADSLKAKAAEIAKSLGIAK
jgi:hypothetical protein